MDTLYRYLGLAAGYSQKLSLLQINFVPSNYLVLLGCGFMLLGIGRMAAVLTWFIALPLALVAAVVLVIGGWLAINRNVVFRPRRGGAAHEVRRELDQWYKPPQHVSPDAIDLHVSGRFFYEGGGAQFFHEMPTGFETTDTGERRMETEVNFSSALFGVVTNQKSGQWRVAVPAGADNNFEPGTVYFGGGARPALRLKYVGPTGQPETVVLSFADGAQRTRFAKAWRTP